MGRIIWLFPALLALFFGSSADDPQKPADGLRYTSKAELVTEIRGEGHPRADN
jgi:hypothetical protein